MHGIGRLKAADVMSRSVCTLEVDTSLEQAEAALIACGAGGAPVMRMGTVVGILSRSDIARAKRRSNQRLVVDAMSTNVVTIDPDATLWRAAALMDRRLVNRLPVVDEGRLVGILTRGDLIAAMAGHSQTPGSDPLETSAGSGT